MSLNKRIHQLITIYSRKYDRTILGMSVEVASAMELGLSLERESEVALVIREGVRNCRNRTIEVSDLPLWFKIRVYMLQFKVEQYLNMKA